jgi:hypothetical protein
MLRSDVQHIVMVLDNAADVKLRHLAGHKFSLLQEILVDSTPLFSNSLRQQMAILAVIHTAAIEVSHVPCPKSDS